MNDVTSVDEKNLWEDVSNVKVPRYIINALPAALTIPQLLNQNKEALDLAVGERIDLAECCLPTEVRKCKGMHIALKKKMVLSLQSLNQEVTLPVVQKLGVENQVVEAPINVYNLKLDLEKAKDELKDLTTAKDANSRSKQLDIKAKKADMAKLKEEITAMELVD